MAAASISIHDFLRDARVPYAVVPHRPAFTAQEDAAAAHVPGRRWAKVVICIVDGEPFEAVVPATHSINLKRLLELTGGDALRLAQETEFRYLFPECEVGAMPPLGPLYALPVFVDASLATQSHIVFDAGTHTEAIRMRWSDYAAAVGPIVGSFAEPPSA